MERRPYLPLCCRSGKIVGVSGIPSSSPASQPSGSLSDAEFRQLIALLVRYSEYDMDQWERWKFPTIYDDVFVAIRRVPEPGASDQHYDDVSRFLPGS